MLRFPYNLNNQVSRVVAAGAPTRRQNTPVRADWQLHGQSPGKRQHYDPRKLPAAARLGDLPAAYMQGTKTTVGKPALFVTCHRTQVIHYLPQCLTSTT